MTEQEWLTCCDPMPMIEAVFGHPQKLEGVVNFQTTERQRRLKLCGWCRVHWDNLLQPGRTVVEMVEKHGGANIPHVELVRARASVSDIIQNLVVSIELDLMRTVLLVLSDPPCGIHPNSGHARDRWIPKRSERAAIVRCVLGNPWWRMRHRWKTELQHVVQDRTVSIMARAIRDDRDWNAMPVLADALELADCEDRRVLDHCRYGVYHALGCWVLDLLLGKE